MAEEQCIKIVLRDDQFNGLIDNIPSSFIHERLDQGNRGAQFPSGLETNTVGWRVCDQLPNPPDPPPQVYGSTNIGYQPCTTPMGNYSGAPGGYDNRPQGGFGMNPYGGNQQPQGGYGVNPYGSGQMGYNPPGPSQPLQNFGGYNPAPPQNSSYGNNSNQGTVDRNYAQDNASLPNVGSLIGGMIGGKKGDFVGSAIGKIIGSGGGKNKKGDNRDDKYHGGGPSTQHSFLSGGVCDTIGNYIGKAAHKFIGVDVATGKIIGSVAGNLLFQLGGKDNNLGNIGKKVLDNIVSGKFQRHTQPFVPKTPSSTASPSNYPRGPVPPGAQAQDFYALRDQCLRSKHLIEDSNFPATDSSLYYSRRSSSKRVVWLRPGEIVRNPMLISEGHSRFDVVQGELGDCWLMAAAANLTLRDELFYRVVPPDQSFTDNYAGIFHFQFWQYGRWIDVVIDDRLPTYNGKLLYMHSNQNNEFWSALLEKAYAKVYGSYEALKGGTTSEALEDMTGGLTEFIDLTSSPRNIMELIMRGIEMGSLFGCSIEADPRIFEARLHNGLIKGHAYSITGMRLVNGPRGQVPLIRIRNPWGNEQEWNGAWSDGSPEWRSLSSDVKRSMGLTFSHDGEFWMSFNDFMKNFEKLEICNLGPDVIQEVAKMTGVQTSHETWAVASYDAAWRRGQTAGGCRNYLQSFSMNPQFWIHLTDSDPNDDDNLCTLIIGVMQKYRREMRSQGLDTLAIGFALYEVRGCQRKLDTRYFANTKSCGRSAAFINLREVSGRFRVPPGEYVIVPSAYEPNEEAEFMVRIFTNGILRSHELLA